MKNLTMMIFAVAMFLQANSQQWITSNLGDSLHSNGGTVTIYDIHRAYDDSLYIIGGFANSGTKVLNSIAVWGNNNWHKIDPNGLNLEWDDGKCLYKYNGILYVGGGFSGLDGLPIANFAMWDGQDWYGAAGGNPDNDVFDIIEYHDTIYVCGTFNAVAPAPFEIVTTVASYFDDSLHNIDEGCYWAPGSTSSCFEIFKDELYIANHSGSNEGGVWKYKGGKCWEIVSDCPNGWIYGLVTDTFNTFMYAGGEFYVLGNENWKHIAMYDGYRWHKIGGNGDIGWSLFPHGYEIYRGDLYVGSPIYDSISNSYNGHILRWDGQQVHSLSIGPNNYVAALEVYHDTLWVGGAFTYVDDTSRAYGLAKWFMPDTSCNYIKPLVYSLESDSLQDTFNLVVGEAAVQFYNNNPYVDSWSWDFGDSGTDTVKDPLHIYTDTGTYNVQVTVSHNGCVKTAEKTVYIQYPLNVVEVIDENPGFKLYPNPTSNTLYIEITDKLLFGKELQIVDMNGKTIIITSLRGDPLSEVEGTTKQSVDIKSLPKGVYFVKIGDKTERFVKE